MSNNQNDKYKNMTDEEILLNYEKQMSENKDVHSDDMVVASKFSMSDLIHAEDWLAIWLGFVVIILSIISLTIGIFPESGPFSFTAAKFSTWGTAERPSFMALFTPAFIAKWLLTLLFFEVLFGVGIALMKKDVKKFIPAFAIIYLLASLVYILSANFVMKQYFEYAVWALLIGLLISNTVGTPKALMPALNTEFYIKTGLVIMGGEVLFSNIAKFGIYGLAIGWIVPPTVIVLMWLFGTKSLKMENKRMVMVIAAATSVCGVSAAIAAAAACKAKKVELTFAIGLSMIFTILMMIAMPLFIEAVGMSPMIGGAWIGGTIDSTGAVVLAGEALGPEGGQVAALVKMIQNVLIGFVAFAIAIFFTTSVDRNPNTTVGPSEIWHRFPKFILGFIAASLVSSFILLPQLGMELTSDIISAAGTFKGWCFCLAFISIGLESNFKEMAAQMAGGKPMTLYIFGQTLNVVLTLIIAWFVLSGNFLPIPDLTTFVAE